MQSGTADTPFARKLHGLFYGIMKWDDLAAFWQRLDPAAGWYLYALGEAVPRTPADAQQVRRFIADIDRLLREEHREDYCSIVYADDLERPTFVKIYDPNHLGSACGSSKTRTLPGWIMSLTPPEELTPPWVVPNSRRRWWQNLLASGR